ncbi:MAG: FAD-binding protein [archaeon]
MEQIKTHCLVIGAGAGGISAGIHFLDNFNGNIDSVENCILLGEAVSNSAISPWNIIENDKELIREMILKAGENMSDYKVLNTFVEKYPHAIKFLERFNIPLQKSNLGKVPSIKGSEVLNIITKEFEKNGGKRIIGHVKNFLTNNGEIKGVVISHNGIEKEIFANQIIIAGGGLTNLYKYSTGFSIARLPNILALSLEAGLKIENLEFNMFHPFLITEDKMPKVLISGEILQRGKYIDEDGNEFLSEEISNALKNNHHHSVFPQMTREFYRQSLRSKIYMDLSKIDKDYFENYKKTNEFGWVFKDKNLDEVQKFEIHPAFHFSIGGIKINEKAETNCKNIYAVGEISSGLHGCNRIGGFAISEALIFGKIAGELASSKAKAPETGEFEKVGNSSVSNELKEKVWENLGPVKKRNDLEKFKEEIIGDSSDDKLVLAMINSSLNRESIGTHFIEENLI